MANGHNNYTHDNATAPGIALAHTVYGEPVTASVRPGNSGEGVAQATQTAFRPYQPPKRRLKDNPDRELCAHEDCKAFPIADRSYCAGHARSHGEMKTCSHRDCKAPPKKGTNHCRWHSTTAVTDEPD